MHDLIGLINHLAAAALAEQPPQAPVRLRQAEVDGNGFSVAGWLELPQVQGEFRLRVDVLPAVVQQGSTQQTVQQTVRQTVRLRMEHCPEQLPGWLAALRPVLERAQAQLELVFPGPTQAGAGQGGSAQPGPAQSTEAGGTGPA